MGRESFTSATVRDIVPSSNWIQYSRQKIWHDMPDGMICRMACTVYWKALCIRRIRIATQTIEEANRNCFEYSTSTVHPRCQKWWNLPSLKSNYLDKMHYLPSLAILSTGTRRNLLCYKATVELVNLNPSETYIIF